ncbi:MAG: DUF4251 domain-containing protein [Bacteroidia bacterium]|nr:DUF4251 domain-containing protein [Bacteroidia bacterium]
MKRIIFLIVCIGISCIGNSQDIKSERKARKDLREAEMLRNYNALGASVERKNFVIEMEYILDDSGNRKKLNQMLNYILIDSTSCVWQSESSDINTDLFKTVSKVEGTIDTWKLAKNNKHSSYFLQFKMFTDNGLYHLTMSINSDKTVHMGYFLIYRYLQSPPLGGLGVMNSFEAVPFCLK